MPPDAMVAVPSLAQIGRAGEVGLDEGRSSRIICGTLMFVVNAGNLCHSAAILRNTSAATETGKSLDANVAQW